MDDEFFPCLTIDLRGEEERRLRRDTLSESFWLGMGIRPKSRLARHLTVVIQQSSGWSEAHRLVQLLEEGSWQAGGSVRHD